MSSKIAHENFIDDFSKLLQSDREFVITRINFGNNETQFVVTVFKDANGDQYTVGERSNDIEVALENAVSRL